MTAPLLNASTLTPTGAAGGAAGLFGAAATGGPVAGFEALMAAFFGGPGAAEPTLGADGKPVVQTAGAAKKGDKDAKLAADGKAEGEVADTATPSTDAQILAALLAQPIAAPLPMLPATAEGQVEGETPAGGSAAPAFGPVVSDAALAQALQTAKAADAKTTNTAGVVAQAAADATTAEASEAQADTGPAHLAGGEASSVLEEGKPAAARQPATAVPPPPPEAAAPRPVTPPPAAAAAAAAAVAATNPAPQPTTVADSADAPAAVEAVVAADAVEAVDAEPAAPSAAPKAKTAARAARNEAGARTEPTATPPAAVADADPLGPVVAPAQTAETFDSGAQGKREDAAPAVEAKADTDNGQPVAPNVGEAAATASTSAPVEARAGPQTVAHLAAQIVKKLEGRSTQFDVALNPEGMGRVDVRIEIGAQGRLTASMSFENPQAAAELRIRAGELQKALEQAGFDVSGGLRFDVAADRGHGQAGQGQFGQDAQNNGGAWRGKAFQAALDSADQTADAALSGGLNLQRRTLMSGVDVRI